jgi:riboflavin transporter FmnP
MRNGALMKHFIGVAVLVVLALVVRFWAFQHFTLDVHMHDTYYVITPRIIGFWLLMGMAAVWFVIAVYKFGRHSS